jgi:hypothetical protein
LSCIQHSLFFSDQNPVKVCLKILRHNLTGFCILSTFTTLLQPCDFPV